MALPSSAPEPALCGWSGAANRIPWSQETPVWPGREAAQTVPLVRPKPKGGADLTWRWVRGRLHGPGPLQLRKGLRVPAGAGYRIGAPDSRK